MAVRLSVDLTYSRSASFRKINSKITDNRFNLKFILLANQVVSNTLQESLNKAYLSCLCSSFFLES